MHVFHLFSVTLSGLLSNLAIRDVIFGNLQYGTTVFMVEIFLHEMIKMGVNESFWFEKGGKSFTWKSIEFGLVGSSRQKFLYVCSNWKV